MMEVAIGGVTGKHRRPQPPPSFWGPETNVPRPDLDALIARATRRMQAPAVVRRPVTRRYRRRRGPFAWLGDLFTGGRP